MSQLGRVVADKYRILHEIGRGGMGSVWLADHTALSRKVAVKFLEKHLAKDHEARARFEREARAAAPLASAHVTQVFDYGIDSGDPYIVMEHLHGETLADRIHRSGRLPLEDIRRIARQTARGLAKAHSLGVVHRDLKPANVFLVDGGSDWYVKLLDFGLAKLLGPGAFSQEVLTAPGQKLGTWNYMSPEQFSGGPVDERADVWAFGALIFECLTGENLFTGDGVPDLFAAICKRPITKLADVTMLPAAWDTWLERAICRDVEKRERSVVALADDFLELRLEPTGRIPLNPSYVHSPARSLDTFASTQGPGASSRVASSIPAGINGRRDLNHIGLITSINQKGAALWTRRRCKVGQVITLTLHFDDQGDVDASARVRRVSDEPSQRPEIWHYEVEVRFNPPLEVPLGRLAPLEGSEMG